MAIDRIVQPVPGIFYILEQIELRVQAKTAGLGIGNSNIRTDIDIRMFPPEHASNELVVVPTHIAFAEQGGKAMNKLVKSQIDVYLRNRNMLDSAHRTRAWLKSYYAIQTALFKGFNDYWMRGQSADSLNGAFIVDEPIKPFYFNEPRISMRDPNQGEGMIHLLVNFYIQETLEAPDA